MLLRHMMIMNRHTVIAAMGAALAIAGARPGLAQNPASPAPAPPPASTDTAAAKPPHGSHAHARKAPHAHPVHTAELSDSALAARWPVKGPEQLPGALLPHYRIVAYYGNPMSRRMGILGQIAPDSMLARL